MPSSKARLRHADDKVGVDLAYDQQAAKQSRFLPDLSGEYYLNFLKRFHEAFQPETYLEIGSRSGNSLALATCSSVAIDPVFDLKVDVVGKKPMCLIYQGTSDAYFAKQDPTRLFGRPVDLAFLDGLHWFEFLLRDFMNAERFCCEQSAIVMHDCIPTDIYVAERIDDPVRRGTMGSKPTWWAGDVWKIVPILKKWRPDLGITGLDCAPTGLIVVTGLDPQSTILAENYQAIVAEFADLDLGDYGLERLHAEINEQAARGATIDRGLTASLVRADCR